MGSGGDARFEIQELAGKGGMGTVFRARDRETNGPVALKIVEREHANARFEREASLLAKITDEGIVRYVSHGTLGDGRMYLAMEWLEGTPLDVRLERGPLSIAECLQIGRRIAGALSAAHRLGVVHRDVKPSNVILRGGQADQAVLVDFGIARATNATHAMTATGAVIGTPAYMAPEQARGERAVDARADLFALGCVLFECACGRPAFVGEHVIAVLAKILLEPAPRARALRADVPRALDQLIAALLAKDPAARPESADVVVRRLDALARGELVLVKKTATGNGDADEGAAVLGAAERRLVTVLLARLEGADAGSPSAGVDSTLLAGVTVEEAARESAEVHGITLTPLADGTVLGALVADDAGPDTAERVARFALAIQASAPRATIALATGRAIVEGDLPVGDVIDRAARLFAAERTSGIWIDVATASLIESRFEVAERDGRAQLIGARAQADQERTVLGRVVPFVGRDRELTLLESTFDECASEPIARTMLVIADAGIGKSRLQRELAGRLAARAIPPAVWFGAADPMARNRPYALLADVLRRAQVTDVTAGAQVERSVVDAMLALVAEQTKHAPLLIVLDDVHFADAVSLRALGAVLARAKSMPVFVVASARATVDDVHPRLWEEVRCQRLLLEPLLRKASATIARALLGERPEIDAIVERAAGNALFVEELTRACAVGGCSPKSCACTSNILDDLPPTVAAATEARFAALDATDRQVMRAAAVFGERFWTSGVAQLLGEELRGQLAGSLERLESAELVLRSETSRLADEPEWVFRHALVRSAAYATLTEEDRRLGHTLAAEWLEKRSGDGVLATHHRQLADGA